MMDLRAGRGTKVLLNVFETKKATYIRLGRRNQGIECRLAACGKTQRRTETGQAPG